ncbi:hypothetical protein Ahy_B10g104352 isoform D [Arachis hypogaea]|uniref:Uncharacterized protein n=1 Tax=Arachis hypogaea TaxID=3818 RepID=A0A444X595_ARAHY|nr:hypothetical protein Ahy_B10g104352 isoform D [Arachis hypogaea]
MKDPKQDTSRASRIDERRAKARKKCREQKARAGLRERGHRHPLLLLLLLLLGRLFSSLKICFGILLFIANRDYFELIYLTEVKSDCGRDLK